MRSFIRGRVVAGHAAEPHIDASAAEPHIDTAAAEPRIDTAPRPFGRTRTAPDLSEAAQPPSGTVRPAGGPQETRTSGVNRTGVPGAACAAAARYGSGTTPTTG